MFPTFTGTSRRPRNVNLSGQKHINPFAAHALSPSSGIGASRTVAEAQAGRRQRQQEREELKAARVIQRTWRGHQVRRSVKDVRRGMLADLYGTASSAGSPEQRIRDAFPLLLSAYDARRDDSRRLLRCFAEDLVQTDYGPLVSGQLPPTRLWHLVQILVSALDHEPSSPSPLLLRLLLHIVRVRPHALLNSLKPYFRMLARCSSWEQKPQGETAALIQEAVVAPLSVWKDTPASFVQRAYAEFAMAFLTQPVRFFEENVARVSQQIDIDALSQAVVNAYRTPKHRPEKAPEELLWLLAHVVDLQRNARKITHRSSSLYLNAVYTQLSALSGDIRLRLPSSQEPDEQTSPISPYLVQQIRSLVDKDEITGLLDKFTLSQSSTTEHDYASLLAGYAIVLIRCFPDKGDDIRMQFFLADLPTQTGLQPAIQFFWEATRATTLFARILTSPRSALDFLLQRKYFPSSSAVSGDESSWDREWRTVLLFLELYTFVLRLTDDDDFFSAFQNDASSIRATSSNNSSSSRLRASALSLDVLKTLSSFLKNLAFTLHYHAADLLQKDDSNGPKRSAFRSSARRYNRSGSYHVIAGLDFHTFKSVVTTTIQMLYERDSRRQFLPTGHWLMTSSFDMAQFLPAVVSEEQRQHELRQQGDGGDDDIDMDENEDESEDELDEQGRTAFSRTFARTSRYAQLEKLRRLREKNQRDRLLETIGPKLEILRNMPYVLPFEVRVKIFREFVQLDKIRRREGNVDPDAWRGYIMERHGGWGEHSQARAIVKRHSARIRRDAVFETAYDEFWELGEGLKEPIQITFIDEYGNEEAGIDGGGVTKEFLTCALMQVLSPESEVFSSNKENAIFPNPTKLDQFKQYLLKAGVAEGSDEWDDEVVDLMRQYEFIGRMIGKCLYEGILIDFVFAGFFLLKWSLSTTDSAYRASLNDLREMDEELYQGMLRLKNYDGDVAELDLDFTIEDQISSNNESPLRTETRNLIPNGDKIRVTNENRPLYISYVARHRLMAQPYLVTKAFLRGLGTIIDPVWLRMFNQNELQRLVGGDSSEIDVDDLRRNTIYAGVYEIGDDHQEHPTVKLFWDVVQSLPDEDRRLLLKYVTSTPRAPLLGFSQLSPKFSIRDGGGDETRLPSTSTCVNLLKLPRYSKKETLRSKLLYAIRSNARFDLS